MVQFTGRTRTETPVPEAYELPGAIAVPGIVQPIDVADVEAGGLAGLQVFHPGVDAHVLGAFVRHLKAAPGLRTRGSTVTWTAPSAALRDSQEAEVIKSLQIYLTSRMPAGRWMAHGSVDLEVAPRFARVQPFAFRTVRDLARLIVSFAEPGGRGWNRREQQSLAWRLRRAGQHPLETEQHFFVVACTSRSLRDAVLASRLVLAQHYGHRRALAHIAVRERTDANTIPWAH